MTTDDVVHKCSSDGHFVTWDNHNLLSRTLSNLYQAGLIRIEGKNISLSDKIKEYSVSAMQGYDYMVPQDIYAVKSLEEAAALGVITDSDYQCIERQSEHCLGEETTVTLTGDVSFNLGNGKLMLEGEYNWGRKVYIVASKPEFGNYEIQFNSRKNAIEKIFRP
ncbi:MAG: hypothetical protein V1859_02910 [archaeon]